MINAALDSANRRLRELDTKHDISWMSEHLHPRSEVPDWFEANGNVLLMAGDRKVPNLFAHPGLEPPRDALVIIGFAADVSSLLLWGSNAKVLILGEVYAPALDLNCGGESTIYMGHGISAGTGATLNARNGGSIIIDGDALWSTRVTIYTDDMHAIRDAATGKRLNARGGRVRVGSHVWLGNEVLLLPGADVGAHAVVGARAVVTGSIPPNTIAVGSPARVVREGVTWTFADEP